MAEEFAKNNAMPYF